MKKVDPFSAEVICAGKCSYLQMLFDGIRSLLGAVLPEETLAAANRVLAAQNRKQVTLDDVAKIAYVHARSVAENKGESPVTRIEKYCANAGDKYDRGVIGKVTDLLLACEFLKLEQDEDRKAGRCRRFSLAPEVVFLLREGART